MHLGPNGQGPNGVRYNFQSQDANDIMMNAKKDGEDGAEKTAEKDDLNDTKLEKEAAAAKLKAKQ